MVKCSNIPSVIVFGADGMFGRMAVRLLNEIGQVISIGRKMPLSFEVEDDDHALMEVLSIAPGALVINAIGMLASAIDSRNPASVARAMMVNAVFPHRLAAIAAKVGSRIIHISTDAVFSSSAGEVTVNDDTCPEDKYGISKLAGEPFAENVVSLRCSIIGPANGRGGLWQWFVGQPEGVTVKGYVDHHWSGCTTLQLARLCVQLCEEDTFKSLRDEGRVYHFAPNLVTTKFELLKAMGKVLRPDLVVVPAESGCEVRRILLDNTGFDPQSEKFNNWERTIADCASLYK